MVGRRGQGTLLRPAANGEGPGHQEQGRGQAETTPQATQSLEAKDQAFQRRRKEADEARAKAEPEAEQAGVQRENCDKARNNLSALQNCAPVYTMDAAGQ